MDLPDLPPGTRVKIHRDPEYGPGPWPAETTGSVIDSCIDEQGAGRDLRMYWVKFDEPQYDTDGDGPYESSQVAHFYIEALSTEGGDSLG